MTTFYSRLGKAGLESSASDPATDLFEGRIYYNSTAKEVRVYNGSSWVSTSAGSGSGQVPVGGVIAVMPQLTGAYSLPDSGAVSAEGWMRCDGAAIPGGQTLSGTLPDLTGGRFIYGTNNSGIGSDVTAGSTGGANSVTLASNQIPQLSTPYTPSGSVTVNSLTAAAQSWGSTSVGANSVNHQHAYEGSGQTSGTGSGIGVIHNSGSLQGAITGSLYSNNINHVHSVSGSNSSSSVTGSLTYTPSSSTITVGTASGSLQSVSTVPSYVAGVYLIRVT